MYGIIKWNYQGCDNYKENFTTLKPVFSKKQKAIFYFMYLRSYFSRLSYNAGRNSDKRNMKEIKRKYLKK